ncbi:MAG: metal ABC transporter substrate-binding protein [Treponema sp.]|jgi:zinc transport system substrate-binding protein|nr:metal ABC transporter substrate-binding protein [Treponema sp.]
MKRFFIIISLLIFCGITVFAKPQGDRAGNDNGKVTVVTTVFPPYDFIREIAGANVNLSMLLPPGAESHSFEPTPQDIIKIQRSDIFIYVGGESDAWADRILSSIKTGKTKIISLMDCVDVVEEELVEGMQEEEEEEHDHDHEEAELDEHVWTSPRNAKLIVEKISAALCEADPANAPGYRTNTAAYLEKLDVLDAAFRDVVSRGTQKPLVFGDRFPFRYFADAYGLSYFAAFRGCSTETEASAATVAFLINKVRDEKIPVVFHIELSNEKIADTICEATGAKKLLFHAAHNVTKRDFDRGITYLEIMTGNAETLKEALH